jgi:hypothetical protein
MTNITQQLQGNILTLTIDVSKMGTPSASGKSIVIATTSGNAAVQGTDLKLGLNLYRAAPAR